MTTKDEALKLALEALNGSQYRMNQYGYQAMETTIAANNEAITAIRAALASKSEALASEASEQPAQQQEPVKIVSSNDMTDADWDQLFKPPASKPWMGLTDEEVMEMAFNFDVPSLVIRTAEAKLREKNEPREKNA